MITYTTSDGKKFTVFDEAKTHEAELEATARQKEKEETEAKAKKAAYDKEKANDYAELVKCIDHCKETIKNYNTKYNDSISFSVKLHFDNGDKGNIAKSAKSSSFDNKPETTIDLSSLVETLLGL